MNILLDKIFAEAESDSLSVSLSNRLYKSYMYKGVQIINDSDSIRIYSPRGMDYYDELSVQDYKHFKNGWHQGVYHITLKKYRQNLDKIEKKITYEMNNGISLKALDGLRNKRSNVMTKYFQITQKLNQLK